MITVTEAAAKKAIVLLNKMQEENGDVSDKEYGLRMQVVGGGCSGFQYGLNIEDKPEDDDDIWDQAGVRIFVDPFSAQYLEGVEIDYVTSMMGAGFTFRNPNSAGGCGCGSSFAV